MDFCGWEKLSLVDYDQELSTTLFMAGCPFRCPFCHNSDLVLHPNEVATIPWDEIMDFLKRRVGILEAVVITGGEPTLMPDLEEKIRDIKSLGYKVKLDTNGDNPSVVKRLVNANLLDYIAMDIKNSKAKYPLTTGVPSLNIAPIEESVSFIMECGIDYEFRTTIIDEFHSIEDMEQIGEWIKGAKHYYLQKYIDNKHCIQHGLHEVPKEKAERFISVLASKVPNAKIRNYD